MTDVLVLGDGAKPPRGFPASETVLSLTTQGNAPNVRLQIDVFRTKFLRELPNRLDDLLRLAAFVYAADTRISRGSPKDAFGKKWSRTFKMIIPMWDLDFWEGSGVHEELSEILEFLTGDEYLFRFVQRTQRTPQQGILQFKELIDPLPSVDSVILFSGGIDSLAAALEAFMQGRRPILVSHRAAPIIDSRQRNLVHLLQVLL